MVDHHLLKLKVVIPSNLGYRRITRVWRLFPSNLSLHGIDETIAQLLNLAAPRYRSGVHLLSFCMVVLGISWFLLAFLWCPRLFMHAGVVLEHIGGLGAF